MSNSIYDGSANHGYNIGACVLPLQEQVYNAKMGTLDKRTSEIEKITHHQKRINALLTAISNEKKKGVTTIDLNTPEGHELVDAVREIDHKLIPHGEYSWHKDQITYVEDNLKTHVSIMGTDISNLMTHNNAEMQEVAELIKLFRDLNKQYDELIKSITRNR